MSATITDASGLVVSLDAVLSAKSVHDAVFEDVCFDDLDLREYYLVNCRFKNCSFITTKLTEANLNGSRFENCYFHFTALGLTNLTFCVFRECRFEYVNMRCVDLYEAEFIKCSFYRTAFIRCELAFTGFHEFIPDGLSFNNCILHYASFEKCDLGAVCFAKSDMTGVTLVGCKLNWSSHELLGELLMAKADNVEQRKVAAYVTVSIGVCWSVFLRYKDPLTSWALDVLREYIVESDNCPVEYFLYNNHKES